MLQHVLTLALTAAAAAATGCGVLSNGGGGAPPGDGGGDDRPDAGVPVVHLSVSNLSPLVNEEVLLVCSVVRGTAEGVTFDFQPADGRLFIDPRAGTALFIVEPSDVSSAFSFACTGTNSNGTSEPSNVQVIIPTS